MQLSFQSLAIPFGSNQRSMVNARLLLWNRGMPSHMPAHATHRWKMVEGRWLPAAAAPER